MARPSPSPPCARVVLLSAWRKRSKTCGRNSGAMPQPVSVTRSSTSSPSRGQRHVDRPPARREPDRIRQQIPDDLLQTARVGMDHQRRRIDPLHEHDVLRVRGGADRLDCGLDDRAEGDVGRVQLDRPRRDTRHVEQFLDHLCLNARVAFDDVNRVADARPVVIAARENRRPAENRIQWRPQLVRKRGEEFVLRPVRGFRLPSCVLLLLHELADGGRHRGQRPTELAYFRGARDRHLRVGVSRREFARRLRQPLQWARGQARNQHGHDAAEQSDQSRSVREQAPQPPNGRGGIVVAHVGDDAAAADRRPREAGLR